MRYELEFAYSQDCLHSHFDKHNHGKASPDSCAEDVCIDIDVDEILNTGNYTPNKIHFEYNMTGNFQDFNHA